MLHALLTAVLPLLAAKSPVCADPAITSAISGPAHSDGDLKTYDVTVTVMNLGLAAQPSSLLQSVEIDRDETKVDQKGVPPLKRGGSATVHYRLQRAAEAREGSTRLTFKLLLRDPHGVPVTDCTTANDRNRLSI